MTTLADRLRNHVTPSRAEMAAYADEVEALEADRDECPQGVHGWRQRTPNGLCPWCEWENLLPPQPDLLDAPEPDRSSPCTDENGDPSSWSPPRLRAVLDTP